MANYPLNTRKNDSPFLSPGNSGYSDEYCAENINLYLHSEVHESENGKLQEYYRLYAKEPHSTEMALAYDIRCPHCYSLLKKVTRCNSYHDLGLYTCPTCNKR